MQIAVIGLGRMGMIHFRTAHEQIDAVERIVCVTSRPERFADLAGVETAASLEALLARPRPVDAAIVAVPAAFHYAVTRSLLAAGIPTLLEKPFAATLAEAEGLCAEARRRGTLLMPGHSELFGPALAAARPLLQAPRYLASHKLKAFESRSTDVGTTLNTMYHDLYMLQSFAWFRPAELELTAATTSLYSAYDDIALAEWRGAGLTVHLHADRLAAAPVRTWDVVDDERLVSIDFKSFDVHVYPLERYPAGWSGAAIAALKARREPEAIAMDHHWPITREQEHFLACVRGEAEPQVTPEDGLRTMELADRIGRLEPGAGGEPA